VITEMTQKKKTYLKYIIWVNLIFGLQNLYYYVNNDSLFNFAVGALNIECGFFIGIKQNDRTSVRTNT